MNDIPGTNTNVILLNNRGIFSAVQFIGLW